jgi:hypothetical protein
LPTPSQTNKKKREKIQINKIRCEKGGITTYTNEILRFIREYFEKLYSNKLENLEEMDTCLGAYDLQKLNQGDINHLNKSIISSKIWAIIVSQKEKLRTR